MKNILLLVLITGMFIGCNKEPLSEPDEVEIILCPSLVGTSWVIDRYDNAESQLSYFPSDTLNFISDTTYSVNNGSTRSYSLYNGTYPQYQNTYQPYLYDTEKLLTLNDCLTLGGSYRGVIKKTGVDDGQLNNIDFEEVNTISTNDIIIWVHRI
ncbi:MAG: hypothetical protein ACI837_003086 [Crocinitomicaceae bacterium]|jgi:hypothetical protein